LLKYEASSDVSQRSTAAVEPESRTTHQTSSEIKEKYLISVIKMAVFIFRILHRKESGSQPCFETVYSSVSVSFISCRDQDSTALMVWLSNNLPVKLKGRG
jgi:hypothetical protein